jgi:hypothetical protein
MNFASNNFSSIYSGAKYPEHTTKISADTNLEAFGFVA